MDHVDDRQGGENQLIDGRIIANGLRWHREGGGRRSSSPASAQQSKEGQIRDRTADEGGTRDGRVPAVLHEAEVAGSASTGGQSRTSLLEQPDALRVPSPAPGAERSAAYLPKGMGSKVRVSSATLLDEVSLKDRRLGADPASPPAPAGGGLERVGKNLLFPSARSPGPHKGSQGSVGGGVWSKTLNPHADPRAELKVKLVKENDFLVPDSDGIHARVARGAVTGKAVSPVVPGTLPSTDSGTLNIKARSVPFGPQDGHLIAPAQVVDPVPNEDPEVSVGITASASSPVASLVAVGDELAVSEDLKRGRPVQEDLVHCIQFGAGNLLNRAGKGATQRGLNPPLPDRGYLAKSPPTTCDEGGIYV